MAARTLPTTMMSAGGLLVNPSSGILLGEGNTGSTMNPSSEDTNCFTWATQAADCVAEVEKTSVYRCSDSMKPPPNNHYCAIESLLGVDQELINQVLWCQDSVDDNQGVPSVQQPSFRDSRRPNNNGESYRNEGFDIHDQFFGNSGIFNRRNKSKEPAPLLSISAVLMERERNMSFDFTDLQKH
jgi:hypothetical protein